VSDEFKVQWSVSLPPAAQYAKGDMLNVRGNSVAEVEEILDEILRDKFIDKAAEVSGFFRAAQVVPTTANEAAQGAAQQSQPAQSQGSSGHNCPHGERQYRTGNGRTGAWAAYFCPLPKGDANQCKPEFVDA
jgi:hypothetical protein